MSTQAKKKNLLWLHVIITLVIMFGFRYLPAPDPITFEGMTYLGIFIALIYAWSTTSLIWPSLLGLAAIITAGYVDLETFTADSFGNSTTVLVLFTFIFARIIDDVGATVYLTNWFLSRKMIEGHPYRLIFLLFLAAYVASALASIFATIIILWSIIYNICERYGYKPHEKFPTVMLLSIPIIAVIAAVLLPFKVTPILFLGAYHSITGETIDFFTFVCYSFPLSFVTVLVLLFLCRFVFRVDVSKLSNVKSDLVNAEDLILNKKQKIVFIFLGLFIVLSILSGVVPTDMALGRILAALDVSGILMVLLAVMLLIRVDGEPLYDFKKATNGILWDILLLFFVVFPLSNYLIADSTGIQAFMAGAVGPLVAGRSPIIFILLATIIPTIITNFANNAVVALVMIPIIFSVAPTAGVNPIPVAMLMMFLCNLAFLTPAASAQSGMLFGNTKWLTPKEIYINAGIMIFFLAVVYIVIGIPLGNLLF